MNKIRYFFKNFFKLSNAGNIFFLLLNMFFILFPVMGTGMEMEYILYCLGLYFLSLLAAFSPLGQGLMNVFSGAKKITRIDMREKIMPLVEEVFLEAKKKTPDMTDKINVRIMYNPEPNAFAIGMNTLCVSSGLLETPDDLIKGVIAHEIGHLALQHTVMQVLIIGGNLMMTMFMVIGEIVKAIFNIQKSSFFFSRDKTQSCISMLIQILIIGTIFLWTRFCMLILRGSSRANEYEADQYALEIGYGDELAEALDELTFGQPQATFLQAIYSTHPDPSDRIGRLQSLGSEYRRII